LSLTHKTPSGKDQILKIKILKINPIHSQKTPEVRIRSLRLTVTFLRVGWETLYGDGANILKCGEAGV
jgi:hypothetical protein